MGESNKYEGSDISTNESLRKDYGDSGGGEMGYQKHPIDPQLLQKLMEVRAREDEQRQLDERGPVYSERQPEEPVDSLSEKQIKFKNLLQRLQK